MTSREMFIQLQNCANRLRTEWKLEAKMCWDTEFESLLTLLVTNNDSTVDLIRHQRENGSREINIYNDLKAEDGRTRQFSMMNIAEKCAVLSVMWEKKKLFELRDYIDSSN